MQTTYFLIAKVGKVAATHIAGDKSSVLFLHGIQGNRNLFAGLIKESFLNEHQLVALDLVGFGESAKPDNWDYSLESHVSAVSDLLKQLNINEVHIIGHSLGGMIGTLLLNASSVKVLSLISLEGNLLIEDCGISKEVAQLSFQEFSTRYFIEYKNKLQNSSVASAELRTVALKKVADLAFYRTSKSIVDWSKSGKLKDLFQNVSCRKLLIKGALSSFHTQVQSDWCEQISITNSGHFLLHDNYVQVKKVIQQFLEKQSGF